MTRKTPLTIVLALVAPFMAAGCFLVDDLLEPRGVPPRGTPPPQACTAVGCEDGVNITLKPRDGVFPPGEHRVFVATAEGGPVMFCKFSSAIAGGPEGDGPPSATCAGGLRLFISERVTCTTSSSGDTVSQTCVPVPGQLEGRLTIPGTPSRVRVFETTHTADLLDREFSPVYRDARPNGPSCGPVCRQANAEFEIPDPDLDPPDVACAPSQCLVDANCDSIGAAGRRCMQRPLTGPCVQLVCE